jgi:putative Mg2+ transporter-C (MgtC) family protein
MDPLTLVFLLRLGAAMLCGVILGTERILANKTAGMRTYALVSLGSALFVIISQYVSAQAIDMSNFDPLRMASQVIVGIGFLGAGLIMVKDNHMTGITTAAGIWVAAGIGIACGFGLFQLALISTFFTLFIFIVLFRIENKYVRKLPVYPRTNHSDEIEE